MKKAFTLIELLVVISIIALLLSIVLPSLRKVKDRAKFTVCKSNLHQIGLALHTYTGDNNHRLVPGDVWNGACIQSTWGARCLGHLLETGYLPLPQSRKHAFYCPADRYDWYHTDPANINQPWPFTFEYKWGRSPWWGILISYEFRDSMDGGIDTQKGYGGNWRDRYTGASVLKVARNGIVADQFLNSGTALQHKGKYNILQGDGSVQIINDTKYDQPMSGDPEDPAEIGITNWIWGHISMFGADWDYYVFDAADYILGNPMYTPPTVVPTDIPPAIYWRQ